MTVSAAGTTLKQTLRKGEVPLTVSYMMAQKDLRISTNALPLHIAHALEIFTQKDS